MSHARSALLVAAALLSTGCLGAGVFVIGTNEETSSYVRAGTERGEIDDTNRVQPRAELIQRWGEPDATSAQDACEVLAYRGGLAWLGLAVMPGVYVRVPLLLLPTGRAETRIYLRDGQVVEIVRSRIGALGGLGAAVHPPEQGRWYDVFYGFEERRARPTKCEAGAPSPDTAAP